MPSPAMRGLIDISQHVYMEYCPTSEGPTSSAKSQQLGHRDEYHTSATRMLGSAPFEPYTNVLRCQARGTFVAGRISYHVAYE